MSQYLLYYVFILLQALLVFVALKPEEVDSKKLQTITSVKSLIKQLELPEHIFRTTELLEISRGRKLENFQEYVDHLKKAGEDVIKKISKQIMKEIRTEKNITKDIESTTDVYKKKIENYASENYVTILKSQLLVDRMYMYLDLLSTAHRYLLREQRKYFRDLEPDTNITNVNNTTSNTTKVHEIIFTQTLQFKKEELLYLCNNQQICKPYSAFIYHFHSFINEVMSLENYKFKNFVELLNELINLDEDFTALINGNESVFKSIKSLFANAGNVKESLEVLRALLIHRYKIIHIPDLKRKRKIQAARTILDTLEKVLSFDHGDEYNMNSNVAIDALKTWSKLSLFEIEDEPIDDMSDFINSIFKALCRSGDYFIPHLIDTILTGKINEQEEYKDLFRDGSKNVFAAETL